MNDEVQGLSLTNIQEINTNKITQKETLKQILIELKTNNLIQIYEETSMEAGILIKALEELGKIKKEQYIL